MFIRPLVRDDETFLWDALYFAIYVPPGEALPKPGIVEQPELACYVEGWMKRPNDLGFIAEQNGEPIGAAWLRCWTDNERGYGFVNEATPELSMSMLPSHRGRGVGTKLLRRLLSKAKKNFPVVSLSVSQSNPARRLYEREKFVPVDNSEGSSITMIKKFTS